METLEDAIDKLVKTAIMWREVKVNHTREKLSSIDVLLDKAVSELLLELDKRNINLWD